MNPGNGPRAVGRRRVGDGTLLGIAASSGRRRDEVGGLGGAGKGAGSPGVVKSLGVLPQISLGVPQGPS